MVMQISFQVTVFLFFDKHLKVEWLDHFVVVHLLSHVQLSVAAWTTACQAPLSSQDDPIQPVRASTLH